MNISKSVAEYGAAAVNFYGSLPYFTTETKIPENHIRSFIERRINRDREMIAVAEQSYWQTAHDLSATHRNANWPTEEAVRISSECWNEDADITLYDADTPVAIVQLKKVEGVSNKMIRCAHKGISKLTEVTPPDGYFGALIMDIPKQPVATQVTKIGDLLGARVSGLSKVFWTRSGLKWQWQFACWGPLPAYDGQKS